jgi:hypothetical protein
MLRLTKVPALGDFDGKYSEFWGVFVGPLFALAAF